MSFDIFLLCLRDGKEATFSRTLMDDAFGLKDSINDRDPEDLQVNYPDGGGADICPQGESDIACIAFGHFGGEIFFDALYRLADLTKSVIFWPGSPPCSAITDPVVLKHLQSDWQDWAGPPQLAKDGVELYRCWRASNSIKRAASEP